MTPDEYLSKTLQGRAASVRLHSATLAQDIDTGILVAHLPMHCSMEPFSATTTSGFPSLFL